MMKKINKKGFSLMEVIFYMVLVGILIGIAVPSLGKLKERAELTKIKADSKTIRDVALLEGENYEGLDLNLKLDSIKGRAFLNGKRINDIPKGGEFFEVIDPVYTSSRTTLGGQFYGNRRMDIIYMDDGNSTGVDKPISPDEPGTSGGTDTPEKPVTPGDDGDKGNPTDKPIEKPDFDKYDEFLATDEDFRFVESNYGFNEYYPNVGASSKKKGFFVYKGSKEVIKIPRVIHGNEITDYRSMFSEKRVTKIISDNPNITSTHGMFTRAITSSLELVFDTTSLVDTSGTFDSVKAGEIILKDFNMSNVRNMDGMFRKANAKIIFGDNQNTSKAENMDNMFFEYKVQGADLDLTNLNTKNVKTMKNMFGGTINNIIFGKNFDVSNVTNMESMFASSNISKNIDFASWNVGKVKNMSGMFARTYLKSIDLSNWNTVNVEDFSYMFHDAYSEEIKVDNFNTEKAVDFSSMFRGTKPKTLDLSSFSITEDQKISEMLRSINAYTVYIKDGTKSLYESKTDKPYSVTLSIK